MWGPVEAVPPTSKAFIDRPSERAPRMPGGYRTAVTGKPPGADPLRWAPTLRGSTRHGFFRSRLERAAGLGRHRAGAGAPRPAPARAARRAEPVVDGRARDPRPQEGP